MVSDDCTAESMMPTPLQRTMTADQLKALIAGVTSADSAPIEVQNTTIDGDLRMRHATVPVELVLASCCFNGEVDLSSATFKRPVSFERTCFRRDVSLRGAQFD